MSNLTSTRPVSDRTEQLEDVRVWRGNYVSVGSEIAVVVMSTNSDPFSVQAVQSIIQQDVIAEIAVVNTGVGSLRDELAEYLDRIILIETPTRQFAGGTRNLGIRHTKSPVVAFLAADCLAAPNWLRLRLVGHQTHWAVASALRPAVGPSGDNSLSGWASYLATHFRRIPETPEGLAQLFSLSYRREVFARFGTFDDSQRIGEDTLLNNIVAGFQKPKWDPEILTLHRYPDGFLDACVDQFKRGRRQSKHNLENNHGNRVLIASRLMKASILRSTEIVRAGESHFHPDIVRSHWAALLLSAIRSVGVLFPANVD